MEIEFRSLSKQFEDHKDVLLPMDFAGDVHALAVIGPSGGGKSTLLRILGGLIAPTAGQVWIGGEKVCYEGAAVEAHRKKIGYVFQLGGLFKHMSAIDNIVTPLIRVHGFSKEQARARADELLGRFGLLTEANKKPAALSGGQQQRVAIARAISAKPKLLLLDEPTSALDPEYTTEVLGIIRELKEERLDFVIVTHEMGFARHACEKVLFLAEGQLLEYGDSDTIFQQPATYKLRSFLGKLLEWNI
ncbi:MAG: ATP-binding cassette domain-containing protein [Clostridiales Family XIII bacterium]|jgi:polar amino acid transport system ATP-binding protein|nr:ATP-binding cassette domain-containing protein [Clostridiales Family XIII bacterium]